MKLLYKTSIYFLVSSIIVFTIGSIIFYFLVLKEINREIDELLVFNKEKIIEHVQRENALPVFNNIYDIKVNVIPTSNKKIDVLKDTLLFNELKNKYVSYRALSFSCKVGKQNYKIQLLKSFFEIEDLIKGILTFILLLILFLLLALFVLNIFISQRTFKPFYNMLQKLQNFDITKNKPLDIDNPKTFEFIQLKNELLAMTNKARMDYILQKEFIENSSHEIQTPLAIIKAKCEMLLQSKTLTESELKSVSNIIEEANRLSKLNKALLLITKIENKQFIDNEDINLSVSIDKHVDEFNDIVLSKGITLTKQYSEHPVIKMNTTLSDILFSNLLNNAIKHNNKNGIINIILNEKYLIFRNSGTPFKSNFNNVFQRFFKDKSNPNSLGLGLTIVKKITDIYNMNILYCYENNLHEIKITFNK